MELFCRMHRGSDAPQSILTEHSVFLQTCPNLKKSKWSAQFLMPDIFPVCRLDLKASTACGGNRSLCQSTLPLSYRIFSSGSAASTHSSPPHRYSSSQPSDFLIPSYDPSPAITKVSSRSNEVQSGLRQYLPCSPRAAVSDAHRYLNSKIMHYSESYNGSV